MQRGLHIIRGRVLQELRRQGEAVDHRERAQHRAAWWLRQWLPPTTAVLIPVRIPRKHLRRGELDDGAVPRRSPPAARARLRRLPL